MPDLIKRYACDVNENFCCVEKKELDKLEADLKSLRSFKASVDEALNSGDGTYRP